jgi:apolipoprotein N-acyltransferase
MHRFSKTLAPWAASVASAVLLELPFPWNGPMPAWRSLFAWFALVPLLVALLRGERTPRRGFQLGYLFGVLWVMLNCAWVRDTMMQYGDMPPAAPELLLLAFSLVLGLYSGFFGLLLVWVRNRAGNRLALAAAPLLWVALELAASRVTSVPWDQLGYSQVDNALLTQLAPWTGVYGLSFLLVALNALLAAGLLLASRTARVRALALAGVLLLVAALGLVVAPARPAATATAVLLQPNLDVGGTGMWMAPGEWQSHIGDFVARAAQPCTPFIAGIPETGAAEGATHCAPGGGHADLVAWPESPAPFFESDARFQQALKAVAAAAQAPLVVGSIGTEFDETVKDWREFNSAEVVAGGQTVGRYDKIHLVPFGEYVPFQRFLFFARKLTGKVSRFDRGSERKVFVLNGHKYGVFICYEAVFADEVRQFAKNGAEVFVNLSDDGWYGDTSAPWQHLNMARMRAIENRRWILRDTNNGVTAVIDPYGQVRQSIPRHTGSSLAAGYGFRNGRTFYSVAGDLFAWVCAILSVGLLVWLYRAGHRYPFQDKDRF